MANKMQRPYVNVELMRAYVNVMTFSFVSAERIDAAMKLRDECMAIIDSEAKRNVNEQENE